MDLLEQHNGITLSQPDSDGLDCLSCMDEKIGRDKLQGVVSTGIGSW